MSRIPEKEFPNKILSEVDFIGRIRSRLYWHVKLLPGLDVRNSI